MLTFLCCVCAISIATMRIATVTARYVRFIPRSMRADRADVLQRHGDAEGWDVAAIEREVAAGFGRQAPARAVAAEQVALAPGLAGGGVGACRALRGGAGRGG